MLRKYCDLHVSTKYSSGVNTVAEVIEYAKKLGLDMIVILDQIDDLKTLEDIRSDVKSVETDVNVLVGALIKAKDTNGLHRMVNRYRDNADIIAVYGGDIEINRGAVENPRVDLLVHPELRRRDSGMDHVMMKLAADNGVAVELNFREHLYSYRKIRSYVLNHMRNNIMLAEKYDTSVVVASGAESVWDMRAGRELASLAYICGLDREKAVKTVSDGPLNMIRRLADIKANALKNGVKLPGE